MRGLLLFLILTVGCIKTNGQVIISLLLGDKLNSGKVEFGLDGGLSLGNIHGLDQSSTKSSFNLGFYFDIKLKDSTQWVLHTGVMVKSTIAVQDVPVYSLNDVDLDNAFSDGSVIRRLNYFHVPFMMKYTWKNRFYAEAGPMFALISKCTDEFVATVDKKDDLTHKRKITDNYHPLDAGLIAGVGYRLMAGNGMNLSVRYYYGLIDITIDDTTENQYNRSLYFALGIPIGVGKQKKNAEKK